MFLTVIGYVILVLAVACILVILVANLLLKDDEVATDKAYYVLRLLFIILSILVTFALITKVVASIPEPHTDDPYTYTVFNG